MITAQEDTNEAPQQISEWILLVLAYVFVAARIYTRLFRLHRKLGWADWLLIASALDALGLIICDTLTYKMGVLDEYETSVKLSKVCTHFGFPRDVVQRLRSVGNKPDMQFSNMYGRRSPSLPTTSTTLEWVSQSSVCWHSTGPSSTSMLVPGCARCCGVLLHSSWPATSPFCLTTRSSAGHRSLFMVTRRWRLLSVLCAGAFHSELHPQLGLLPRRIRDPTHPSLPRRSEILQGCYFDICFGRSDHRIEHCPVRYIESWNWSGKSCL